MPKLNEEIQSFAAELKIAGFEKLSAAIVAGAAFLAPVAASPAPAAAPAPKKASEECDGCDDMGEEEDADDEEEPVIPPAQAAAVEHPTAPEPGKPAGVGPEKTEKTEKVEGEEEEEEDADADAPSADTDDLDEEDGLNEMDEDIALRDACTRLFRMIKIASKHPSPKVRQLGQRLRQIEQLIRSSL